MKKIIYLFLLIGVLGFGQNKYLTKNGTVLFEASVPSFEEVKATNNSVTAILNADNGEFAALALVKGFRFKNALMEEHFNENYAESDTYPKATFKGIIQNFELEDLNKQYVLNGSLSFHGVEKPFKDLNVILEQKDEVILLTGNLKTKASEFDIKIPKIVSEKIAEEILISFDFELKLK